MSTIKSKARDPNAFFQADERIQYIVQNLEDGMIWGKDLRFDGEGWRKLHYDSGHDQGAAFEYFLTSGRAFRCHFVVDCRVVSSTPSTNTLSLHLYLNDRSIKNEDFIISNEKKQIHFIFDTRISSGDIIHIRFMATNSPPIELGNPLTDPNSLLVD